MGIGGYCNRCGDCCKKPAVGSSYMLVGDSCKYLRFEGGLATCPFREGKTEPLKAYEYYLKCCVPFPRNESDIISVPRCTYTWEADE